MYIHGDVREEDVHEAQRRRAARGADAGMPAMKCVEEAGTVVHGRRASRSKSVDEDVEPRL